MKLRLSLFISLSAVLGMLFYLCMRRQGFSDLTSYIYLAPLVSAYFLFIDRKDVFAHAQYAIVLPSVLFAFAAAAFASSIAAPGDAQLSLRGAAVVLAWWGLFAMLFGKKSARAALFPLGFLIVCVPLPESAVLPVESVLKVCSAWNAWLLFTITRIPFLRDGMTFHLSNISIEVANECSGINSALSLVITAIIAGRMFLRMTSRRIALAVIALPIACFKNGVRIFTLAAIGNYVTFDVLHGPLHKQGGKPFFILALAFLGISLWALRKTERMRRPRNAFL